MSSGPEGVERRHAEDEVLKAVGSLGERLDSTSRSLNRQLEGFRQKQERQFAIVVALQEHKTIERVDVIWETLTEMRAVWNTAKAVAARGAKFSAWGCGTLLALAGLLVAANAAGIIHVKF